MKIKAVLAIAMCLAMPAVTAVAAGWEFANDAPAAAFTKEDRDIFNSSYKKFLNEGKDGETISWSNPATTAKGELTLLRTSENNGVPCRTLKVANQAKNRKASNNFTFCKQPDGDWKIPASSAKKPATKPATNQ